MIDILPEIKLILSQSGANRQIIETEIGSMNERSIKVMTGKTISKVLLKRLK